MAEKNSFVLFYSHKFKLVSVDALATLSLKSPLQVPHTQTTYKVCLPVKIKIMRGKAYKVTIFNHKGSGNHSPFHSPDLNFSSPHCLPYISKNFRLENLVSNQRVSATQHVSFFSTTFCLKLHWNC